MSCGNIEGIIINNAMVSRDRNLESLSVFSFNLIYLFT